MWQPRVSVLMTTWNGAAFIGVSIGSVLAQSFADFELIVVDDGSTDEAVAVIEAIDDPRVRLLRMPQNGGIVAARNAGFAIAGGTYIAALDHDDLADPERLARQVIFLDANPAVVLVGTEIRIDDNGTLRVPDHHRAGDGLAMGWQLLIDNPLTWSSVMFRAEAVRRLGVFMRGDFEPADDFDFYHRMLALGDVARLDEVLTTYRYHGGNASLVSADRLNRNAARVLTGAYAPWLGQSSMVAAELVVRHLSDRRPMRDRATLLRLGEILEALLAGYSVGHRLLGADVARVAVIAGQAWWRCVRASVRSGSPWLIGAYGQPRVLAAAFRPDWRDVVISVGVGSVRRLLRR